MFRKILVPLDGSELAERAVPYARRLAGVVGRLVLVRAIQGDDREALDEAETYLSAFADRLQQDGSAAEWRLYYGPAPEGIKKEAGLQRADAIVMSTHGRSGVQRLVFGSVAEHVLREADVPVLLIPARTPAAWHASAGQQVVVPLDGSDISEAALEPAIALAGRLGASLLLVGVVESLDLTPLAYEIYVPEPSSDLQHEMEVYLDAVAARVRQRGLKVATQLDVGQPAQTIAGLAAQADTAAVALATHGRGGLALLLMGSVTTDLVRHAAAPLFVIRPASRQRVALRLAVERHGLPTLAGGVM